MKRGKLVAIVAILIIAVLLITGAYIFLKKGKVLDAEKGGENVEEKLKVELTNPICEELVLNIEKVDCVAGERGVNVSVFRREDSLGQGGLIINVTDKQGEARELEKLNFSFGSLKLTFHNSVAGEKVFIIVQLKLVRQGKLIICPGANLTYGCELENLSEEESLAGLVPNPAGSVKVLDIRDEYGEYYCANITNKTINPEHGIRVYSYQKINNTDVLSTEYIESEIIKDVCSYYPGLDEVYYSLLWEWGKVENVSGYYLYQYYKDEYNNINREYNYYIRVLNNLFRDTGLELWKEGS